MTVTGPRDGTTFDPAEDLHRLNGQALAVFDRLSTGSWWTLRQLADSTGSPEASVSARLRDLRKQRFGGMTVQRKRQEAGLYLYRLTDTGRLDDQ